MKKAKTDSDRFAASSEKTKSDQIATVDDDRLEEEEEEEEEEAAEGEEAEGEATVSDRVDNEGEVLPPGRRRRRRCC